MDDYNVSKSYIEELEKQMKSLANDSCSDYEIGHEMADRILCELLCKLGYEDIVSDWNKVGKWYG